MNQVNIKPRAKRLAPGASAIQAPETKRSEIWLGIHFPEISLEAHRATPGVPFVILEKQRGLSLVYRANGAAVALGIVPGMKLSAAYVLCRKLETSVREPLQEEMVLRSRAHVMAAFTPRIVIAGTDCLLLEVRASLRLFGGISRLHEKLRASLEVPHVIACAPVIDAAELMARNGIGKIVRKQAQLQSALGHIPLQGLPLNEKCQQQLQRCGLHDLRDLWRLPRPDLARRFGSELLLYLDRLSGQRLAPRPAFEADLEFRARHEFAEETEHHPQLLYAAEVLLKQADRFLQTRKLLSEQLHFYLHHNPRNPTTSRRRLLTVRSQQGGDTPAHFLPQLDEQLQQLTLESPLTAIELCIRQFKPRIEHTNDLFRYPGNRHYGQGTGDGWPVLLDLLFARLGRQRVYRLQLVADYRPERAWSRRKTELPGKQDAIAPLLSRLPTRPAWLLPEPVRCIGRRFHLVSDAERLETGWWDGDDQRREYYRGIAPSGRHCWLYRDLQTAEEQWYLHGLFA